MNGTQQQAGAATHWIRKAHPWALVLALSTGLTYALNTAAVGALSANRPSEGSAAPVGDVNNPCALDADGALYARWYWWLPAGRSVYCRGETYPVVTGPADEVNQLVLAGRLLATITFEASDTHVDLYCSTSRMQLASDARYLSEQEVRGLREQVCTPGGASD